MPSRLVNVRLDETRLRKVQALRDRGVALSDVVRTAIDDRYAALGQAVPATEVRALVRGIFEEYPDPPDLAPRGNDLRDRRAVGRAIRRRLRRERS